MMEPLRFISLEAAQRYMDHGDRTGMVHSHMTVENENGKWRMVPNPDFNKAPYEIQYTAAKRKNGRT